jgi:protein-tyrosine phosphatase
VLVRSDHVGGLNAEGVASMAAFGVTTVVDLRTPSEVGRVPNPFAGADGPAYLHVPLLDDATIEMVGEMPSMAEGYIVMLDHRQAAFGRVFDALAQAEGATLFHCFAGKDRTGLVAAMLLSLVGVEEQAIAADFAETDIQLAERYEQWLAAASPERRERMRRELVCPPERIIAALDHVEERWGGVEAYLEAGGVSPAVIARLQSTLAS